MQVSKRRSYALRFDPAKAEQREPHLHRIATTHSIPFIVPKATVLIEYLTTKNPNSSLSPEGPQGLSRCCAPRGRTSDSIELSGTTRYQQPPNEANRKLEANCYPTPYSIQCYAPPMLYVIFGYFFAQKNAKMHQKIKKLHNFIFSSKYLCKMTSEKPHK